MRGDERINCDVLIIGAGIAGVAIAERIAREAYRQNKKINVVVVEQSPLIGTQASGGLEGWFHTGALYTQIPNGHTFLNCLKSLEDMTNWYSLDTLFPFHQSCSISHSSEYGIRVNHQDNPHSLDPTQWFEMPIAYQIDPIEESPSWDRTRGMIHKRIENAFRSSSWFNNDNGECQMPDISLDDTDTDQTNPKSSSETLFTDVTMNTRLILQHLVQSAARYGVQFLMSHEAQLDELGDHPDQPVLVQDLKRNETLEFYPTQLILTLGDRSREAKNSSAQFDRFESVMLVRRPPVFHENIVRITPDPERNINHVFHPDEDGGYSILADSNSTLLTNETEIDPIMRHNQFALSIWEKANDSFGTRVGPIESWTPITCVKTEYHSPDSAPRKYSYWWGPEFATWGNETVPNSSTNSLRQHIRKLVSTQSESVSALLNESSWNAKKSIHFSLINSCFREQRTDRNFFDRIRNTVHTIACDQSQRNPHEPISIIAGKFSLFPSLAHNIYIELELRGFYLNLQSGRSTQREIDVNTISQTKAWLAVSDQCVSLNITQYEE